MPHLLAVLAFSSLLGWLAGNPAIAYLAICVELFVTLLHAKDEHPETGLGRLGGWLNLQVLVAIEAAGLLAINHFYIHIFDDPKFWISGTVIALCVGGVSKLWHDSVHPRTTGINSTVSRLMACAVGFVAIVVALTAHTSTLLGSPP